MFKRIILANQELFVLIFLLFSEIDVWESFLVIIHIRQHIHSAWLTVCAERKEKLNRNEICGKFLCQRRGTNVLI